MNLIRVENALYLYNSFLKRQKNGQKRVVGIAGTKSCRLPVTCTCCCNQSCI